MGILGYTRVYKVYTWGIQRVYKGYTKGIQGVNKGYTRDMQRVYKGYTRGIQRVYKGYTRIYRVVSGHYKWSYLKYSLTRKTTKTACTVGYLPGRVLVKIRDKDGKERRE